MPSGELVASIVVGLTAFACYLIGVDHGRNEGPPCFEDQAYVVKVDRNPAHGLTWQCVGLDTLKGAQR